MARPQKEGLDYFPLNCQFNDKLKFIQAEFGVTGFAIVVLLWKKIYSGKGYYTRWDDDVALLFASECGVGVNVVKEVVSACFRRGIFHQETFDRYQILTSEGVQNRYAEATERRTSQKVDGRYLLIPMPKNWDNVNDNQVNADNNAVNVDGNTQRKEEEIKEKNNSFLSMPACAGNITESLVKLTEDERRDLELKIPNDAVEYYIGVVEKCEFQGKHYNIPHHDAILKMAQKDGRLRGRKSKRDSYSSFDINDFFEAAIKRSEQELNETVSKEEHENV